MVMKMIFSGSQQIIQETCEHCDEIVNDNVHISEITVLKPNENRTVTIESGSNDITVLSKEAKIIEVKKERLAANMLTASVVEGAPVTESLKYGIRSEKMCSSSTNSDLSEFCYRVTNDKFLSKEIGGLTLSQSFHTASKVLNEITKGAKVGLDRKGEVIRIKSESITGTSDFKYFGAWKKSWYRDIEKKPVKADAEQLLLTESIKRATNPDFKLENFKYKAGFKKPIGQEITGSVYENNFSIELDGTNDFIGLGDASNTLHYSASDFDDGVTVAAWVYVTNAGEVGHPILSVGRSNNKMYGWGVLISATYKLQASIYGKSAAVGGNYGQSANHRKSVVSAADMKLDQWMFLTWVFKTHDHTTWELYLNGKQISTTTSGNANVVLEYNGDSNMGKLGKSNSAADTFMDGNISNVGVWSTALDAKAVNSLFNDGNPLHYMSGSDAYIQSSSLAGYWQMEEGSGTSTRELSAGGPHGILRNGAAFSDLTQNAP